MPSKGLLRPVEMLDIGRHLPGVKQALLGRELDVNAVLARRDTIVNNLDDTSQVQWCLTTGIDVIRGHGTPRRREDGRRHQARRQHPHDHRPARRRARHRVLAAVPDIDGLRAARPWISRDVTNIHTIPQRIVILGGGVVACEAATWLSGLGVEELTIVEGEPRLLARDEPFAGEHGRRLPARRRRPGRARHPACRPSRGPHVNDAGYGVSHGGEVTVTLDNGQVDRRRRDRRRRRTPPQQHRHRPGVGRPGGRRLRRRRRPPGGRRRAGRMAVRDRRPQRPGAADAHGQVPGPDRRRVIAARATGAAAGHQRLQPARRPRRPRPRPAGDLHRTRRWVPSG